MRKIVSKIVAFMLVMCIALAEIDIKTEAASYPNVFFKDASYNVIISMEATVGDVVHFNMEWFGKYNNEGYDINIYDGNNKIVTTMSDTWTNISGITYLYEKWDTSGLPSGEYKVEVTKKFYSFYRWNEAPTKEELDITLKDAPLKDENTKIPSNIKGLTVKNNSKKAIVVKFKKSKNAKKYEIQYSTHKRFKKNVRTKITKKLKYTIKNLKKNKSYYLRVCAVNGDKTSAWTKVKKVKIKK